MGKLGAIDDPDSHQLGRDWGRQPLIGRKMKNYLRVLCCFASPKFILIKFCLFKNSGRVKSRKSDFFFFFFESILLLRMALFWKGSPQIIKTLSWPPDQTQPLLPVLQALRGRFVAWLGPACLPSPSPPHFSLVMCSSHDFFLLVLMSHVLSSGFKKKKKFFSVLFFQPVQFFSSPSA